MPTTWAPSIGYRLVLRQADEAGYLQLDVPRDVLTPSSPPGRGVLVGTDTELQVAVPGGSSDPATQAAHLASRTWAGAEQPAPAIGRLATTIPGTGLPASRDGRPVLGVAGDTDAAASQPACPPPITTMSLMD